MLEPYFEGTDREVLYGHQGHVVSAVAGSPVSYEGADMQRAHEGMEITEDAFDSVATHLDEAFEDRLSTRATPMRLSNRSSN